MLTTSSTSREPGAPSGRSDAGADASSRLSPILFALSLVTALVLEVWLQRGEPLWLDEAWTVGIAGPAPWIDFFHQVYWDVNAPLYYLLMYLWQGVLGQSDLAMRAPSLIFAVLTPLVLAFSRVEGLGRTERLAWASVTALWFPALCYAQEARCFAMLLFISTCQTLAFIRLLSGPGTGRATQWAVLAALAILTHYDAVFLGAVQGLIYLAVHRLRALRTWPAAMAFVPAFGWLLYHLPRIVQFAQPGIAWYSVLDLDDLTDDLVHLMGERQCWVLLAVGLLAVGLRFLPLDAAASIVRRLPLARATPPSASPPLPHASPREERGARIFLSPVAKRWGSTPEGGGGRSASSGGTAAMPLQSATWLTALAAVLSATTLIVIGFLRPSFAPRYLTPDGPGLLLGIVLLIAGIAGRRAGLALCVLVIALGAAVCRQMAQGERMAPRAYNYERASQLLEKVHPQRLVFLWDHPVGPIEHPEQLAAAGDAFFRRDGLKLSVDPVILKPGEDPNRRLLAGAAPPHSVILWVYDVAVHDTAAVDFPPKITAIDPAWTCRHAGDRFGILACWRKAEAP